MSLQHETPDLCAPLRCASTFLSVTFTDYPPSSKIQFLFLNFDETKTKSTEIQKFPGGHIRVRGRVHSPDARHREGHGGRPIHTVKMKLLISFIFPKPRGKSVKCQDVRLDPMTSLESVTPCPPVFRPSTFQFGLARSSALWQFGFLATDDRCGQRVYGDCRFRQGSVGNGEKGMVESAQ